MIPTNLLLTTIYNMIDIILCIICCALLVIGLKLFDVKGVQSFPAIVINYLTCTLCGFLFLENKNVSSILQTEWLKYALFLGLLFICIFLIINQTAKHFGASTASVAMKLGLVFPIIFSAILYHEPFSSLKIFGTIAALVAVILCSYKPTEEHHQRHAYLFLLPLVAFIGSGACDSIVQFMQKNYVKQAESAVFNFALFFAALFCGSILLIVQLLRKKVSIGWKEIVGGIALGIPNYFSMYFLVSALNNSGYQSSVLFPTINIGTVLLTTFFSLLYFKEILSKLNWLGLGLAVVGIGLMFIG